MAAKGGGRMVGYRRFEGLEAMATLAPLYARARLFVTFFQCESAWNKDPI
jgi:hypothetical protein